MKSNPISRLVSEVNTIIHRDNLFVMVPGGRRRVVNCRLVSGHVVVSDWLQNDTTYRVLLNQFQNGRGQVVAFN